MHWTFWLVKREEGGGKKGRFSNSIFWAMTWFPFCCGTLGICAHWEGWLGTSCAACRQGPATQQSNFRPKKKKREKKNENHSKFLCLQQLQTCQLLLWLLFSFAFFQHFDPSDFLSTDPALLSLDVEWPVITFWIWGYKLDATRLLKESRQNRCDNHRAAIAKIFTPAPTHLLKMKRDKEKLWPVSLSDPQPQAQLLEGNGIGITSIDMHLSTTHTE